MSFQQLTNIRLLPSRKGFGVLGQINFLRSQVKTDYFDRLASCSLLGSVRNFENFPPSKRKPYIKKKPPLVALENPDYQGGIECHGFTYYPRYPDHKDPPIEPSKLFMVRRIRSLYGCPIWEKRTAAHIGVADRKATAVVKNTPENNEKLYQIKHLIEITPITVPYGMPDKPENGYLKDNGQFVSFNVLHEHGTDKTAEEAKEECEEWHKKNIGGKTLKDRLHQRWYTRYDVLK